MKCLITADVQVYKQVRQSVIKNELHCIRSIGKSRLTLRLYQFEHDLNVLIIALFTPLIKPTFVSSVPITLPGPGHSVWLTRKPLRQPASNPVITAFG